VSGQAAGSLVVAVDGPSGSGKSSVCRAVASHLGLRYLDTGAMYRAVTWWMLQRGVDVADPAAIAAAAAEPVVCAGTDPAEPTITVDGADVSAAIRSRAVTNAVSAVSAVPEVRRRLLGLQRQAVGAGGIVVEGRDIGTVVLPDAPVKIFLTASADARAARRNAEPSTEAGTSVGLTREEMARRDRLDSSRASSPLARAPDAVDIDTTRLGLDQVIETVLRIVARRQAQA